MTGSELQTWGPTAYRFGGADMNSGRVQHNL